MENRDKQLEQETQRKIDEYAELTKNLRGYWTELVTEAMRIAKKRGLETYVTDVNSGVDFSGDITVKRDGQEVDVSELIVLAKDRCPETYRDYQDALKKHTQLESDLKGIRDSII